MFTAVLDQHLRQKLLIPIVYAHSPATACSLGLGLPSFVLETSCRTDIVSSLLLGRIGRECFVLGSSVNA